MKADTRGKFPGIRVHLDRDDCLSFVEARDTGDKKRLRTLATSIAAAIDVVLNETPGALADRTPEQVKAALQKEAAKAAKKLEALATTPPPAHVETPIVCHCSIHACATCGVDMDNRYCNYGCTNMDGPILTHCVLPIDHEGACEGLNHLFTTSGANP